MSEEEKEKESGEISRRQFLAGAGMVVGGAAVGVGGAALFIKPGTETITVEVPGPDVVTFVAPDGSSFGTFNELVTYMEGLPGGIEVITEFTCPYDNQAFATLAALGAHLNAVHGGESAAGPGGEVVVIDDPRTALTINGQTHKLELNSDLSLAFVLRETLGLTGTKIGCDRGSCGTCTVIMDGRAVYSCMVLAVEAGGKDIQTIEGLSDGITLSPIQQAFVDGDATQCGFCTPGFIMSAKALLDKNPSPTRDEVREALSGHFCTCGHTLKIVDAVL